MDKVKVLVVFGAGRIGRSFIAQLFSHAGYEIVLVDVDKILIDRLNERKAFPVMIRDSKHSNEERTIEVKNITAFHLDQEEQIIARIKEADILATSVGKNGLSGLTGILNRGIQSRYEGYPDDPIDIILAENVRNAAEFLYSALKKGGAAYPVKTYVGLVETSIGKMVPIMTREQMAEDPLAVYAEPYNNLILDGRAFKNPVPEVPGLSPKDNMKAWVDRKLFIHNLGHATLAYQTNFHYPELVYTWEALEIPALLDITRRTMLQSAVILQGLYPAEFDHGQLVEHTDDLLKRFANKALGDTIFRVGQDLNRKLGKDDRLLVPILFGISLELPFDLILAAWVRGCSFKAVGENGRELESDRKFRLEYEMDYRRILQNHCHLNSADHPELYHSLTQMLAKI